MKYSFLFIIAVIVTVIVTLAPEKAEARRVKYYPPCETMPPNAEFVTANYISGQVTNVNVQEDATYKTTTWDCVECAVTCMPVPKTVVFVYYN